MAALLALLIASTSSGMLNCDVLDLVAPVPEVDYETEIQPIFDNNFCAGCHPTAGGLSLQQGASFDDLVCQPTETPYPPEGSLRVIPGNPGESWLFLRVNCDAPDTSGFRMPVGSALTSSEQGLIRDWIAQGAKPFAGLVFRGGFEDGETCR
ncbi:MAG: hypothetical protein R3200_14890 [Xanthomonadales bacterium]|nr:hypothetical protein [Xanthomonadales bacterium]